tara:strand:+ start:340 stop:1929 length:1590 start_codon:yes stop_codon:yes gene_type:complete
MFEYSKKKLKSFSNDAFENYAGLDKTAEYQLHNLVIDACLKLKDIIPKKYSQYGLENIILAKACSYHTNIDKSLRQYFYINKTFKKLLFGTTLSRLMAGKIIDLKDKKLHESMRNKKFEEFIINDNLDTRPDYSPTEILFFSSQPSHVKVFDSYLSSSKLGNYQLLLPKKLQPMLEKSYVQNSNIIYFEDFFERTDKNLLNRFQEEFHEIYIEKQNEIQALFNFLGKDFFNSQKPGIENIFKYLLPQSLLYIRTFRKILKIKTPNKTVGVRPRRIYDRAAFHVSKSLGIKTYLIFHSTIGADQRELWTSGIYNDVDHIFGWGKKHQELMKSDKFSKKAFFEKVGSPMFNMPPKEARFRHKIPKIIYASTRNDKSIVLALEKAKKSINDVSITLKIHPGEPIPQYANNKLFSIEPGDFPIEDILENYDIFITSYSGSHIAAMCLGLPVLFAPFYFEFPYDLKSLYGIDKTTLPYSYAENEKDLLYILNKVLRDRKYKDLLITDQKNYLTGLLANHNNMKSVNLIDSQLLS